MLSFTENKDRLEAGRDIGAASGVVAAGIKSTVHLSSQWFHQVLTDKAREGKNELIPLLIFFSGYWCQFTHLATTITIFNKMPSIEI